MEANDFRRTLEEHGDRVFSYAVWLLGDIEEAGDVVQDGLMRLWTHRAGVAIEAGRPWLMRTIHRLCIDRFRRRAVRRETALDEAVGDPPARELHAERHLELSELQTEIGRALSQLQPRDRALIVMREMQGMTYQEIARAADLPINTLKPAIHRARERLRRELTRAGVKP